MPGFFDFLKRGGAAERKERIERRSSGLAELEKAIANVESMSVLNLGPTSASNISYFTNRGHGIYSEDLITAAAEPQYTVEDVDGKRFDVARFLRENLVSGRTFDIALCWDTFDYIDESLAMPLARRIYEQLRPGGHLLAFFHTASRDTSVKPACYRYHITGPGMLMLQSGPVFTQKRTLNNRKIEELLKDFSSEKFLLAQDNVREVLARK